MIRIFPSLIAADILNLQNEIMALESYCDGYHIDVMDNHFVPNLTWGQMFVDKINTVVAKPSWVHLMVDNPENWVEYLSLQPKSILTFHFEATSEVKNVCEHIEKRKWIPSIAINPKTPVEKVFPFLDVVHHVLVMSVEPGFSGQHFINEVVEKVDLLVSHVQKHRLQCVIAMDGGIDKTNIAMLAKKGIQDFGVGSGIFAQPDKIEALQKLYQLAK